MSANLTEEIEQVNEESEGGRTKCIMLSTNYVLKYDNLGSKWIEHLEEKLNRSKSSKNYGKKSLVWERCTGYMPTYEWLLWDFCIRKTSKAETKSVHEIIKEIAENEKLISDFAKTIGAELDRQRKANNE